MIFRQFLQEDLACASYMVGDGDVVAVVDPKFEIDEYLQTARYLGVKIEHVLETHNHADHVSGHGRLAAATGATIHVHRLAEPDYEHEAFDDGWELELGDLVIRALHTPGPPAGAHGVRADRPLAVGGSVGGAHRRHAVRRRRRPARSGDRQERGGSRDLRVAARQAARPSGRHGDLARSPRWLDVRHRGR